MSNRVNLPKNTEVECTNIFKSKTDIVKYLNDNGKFWEYCNKADDSLSDSEVIFKSLLYLEFEDMQQLFDLFGFQKCRQIWKDRIDSSPKEYYGLISHLLELFFFR